MKTRILILFLISVVLCLGFAASAQEGDLSIAQLKEQIKNMEAIEQDPTTLPDVRSINRDFLRTRRAQLRSLVSKSIEALRNYQLRLGSSLTSDEKKAIENAISLLEQELEDPGKTSPNTAQNPSGSDSPTKLTSSGNAGTFKPGESTSSGNGSTSTPHSDAISAPPTSFVVQGNCYADAPDLIVTNIDRAAADMVNKGKADPLDAYFPDIFFYTVADAVSADQVNLRKLKAYQYMGETARTDKQVGASARAGGSTSAIEKPGFANLLGFAIENGAIQQQTNATSLTLSTSPYALVAASQGDTAETYQKYDFLNRIGISANFNLTNQSEVLANASRKQLNEWSVRVRLMGDRSTRGSDFRQFWDENIRRKVQRRLVAITHAARVIDSDANLRGLGDTVEPQIRAAIKAILATNDPPTKKTADIKNVILCGLQQSVFDQVKPGGGVTISAGTKSLIDSDLVPGLLSAHQELEQARKDLNDFFAQQEKKPEMTLAYSNLRPAIGGNYSTLNALYERKSFEPVKLVANGGFSIYHKPDSTMNQRSIRDLSFALSFEGKASSPFMMNEQDLSKITYAFTGRYQRIFENIHQPGKKADIAIAQFKFEVPVMSGMSIPFSLTFANASELIKEKHVRANFGFSFDADKVFALAKLKRPQ